MTSSQKPTTTHSRSTAKAAAKPAAPTGYTLTSGTEAAVQQVAASLHIGPDLVVEIAVAEWLRQQAPVL